jgi:phosphomannomutase / phosphoglucomutase
MQITGSHNPPEYNGFKMIDRRSPVYGDAIQALRERIETQRFETRRGQRRERDIIPTTSRTSAAGSSSAADAVVVDCGNGTGSVVAVELLRRTGADVIPLYCESDGTFPNHHPDPTVDEYIQDMIRRCAGEGGPGRRLRRRCRPHRRRGRERHIVRGDILLLLFALDAWSGSARRRRWSST